MKVWIAKVLALVLTVFFSSLTFAYQSRLAVNSAGCMSCHQAGQVQYNKQESQINTHKQPVKKVKK